MYSIPIERWVPGKKLRPGPENFFLDAIQEPSILDADTSCRRQIIAAGGSYFLDFLKREGGYGSFDGF